MKIYDSMTGIVGLAQQSLPAPARGMVILYVLGGTVLILLGFVALTMARWLVRRRLGRLMGKDADRPIVGGTVRELSPWETAGRRATPDNLEGDEHGTHRDEGLQ